MRCLARRENLKGVGIDVVKACLDVKAECGDPDLGPLEGSDVMGEGQAGVKSAEAREGAALMGIKEASGRGEARKPDRHDPFQGFGYSL